jgi:tRNA pseudouridine38-40 synthase
MERGACKNRYFIRFSFLGTNYHGWQTQNNAISVQSVLNETLSVLLKERITCTGAGRTDAGVHAKEFYAHFDTIKLIDEVQRNNLVFHMNGFLPDDIAIQKVFPVNPAAHARFSAVSRTYQYFIGQTKDPFMTGLSFCYTVPLDIPKMNEGAEIIKTCSDFTSFAKLPSETKTNICQIKNIYWEKKGSTLLFTITADRFLRNMVRAIVGTLIDMGRGKTDLKDLKTIIESKNRSAAGSSVPACGLYLTSIVYPDEIMLTS